MKFQYNMVIFLMAKSIIPRLIAVRIYYLVLVYIFKLHSGRNLLIEGLVRQVVLLTIYGSTHILPRHHNNRLIEN